MATLKTVYFGNKKILKIFYGEKPIRLIGELGKEYTIFRDENLQTTSIDSNYPEVMVAHKGDIGQEYSNPFANIYPFSGFGRVSVNKDTGEIIEWLNEFDSNFNKDGELAYLSSSYDIMCAFPKFYYKRVWNGDILEESFIESVPPSHIRDIPKNISDAGYSVYPCFVDKDGNIASYVMYGAFEGTTNYSDQLRSMKNSYLFFQNHPTISGFRDLARQGRNTNYNIETWGMFSMVQTLYKFAFKDLDSKKILGKGEANQYAIMYTGDTLKMGNRSGYLGSDGSQISLFGIENFYGNKFKYLDGMFINKDGFHITHNSADFGDLSKYKLYCGYTADGLGYQGHIINIEKTDIGHIPAKKEYYGTDGYYSDYAAINVGSEVKVPIIKGRPDASWGIFSFDTIEPYSGRSDNFARLCFVKK